MFTVISAYTPSKTRWRGKSKCAFGAKLCGEKSAKTGQRKIGKIYRFFLLI